ncbi:MAG: YihY/virulence factor BrkB family protein [Actinomycetota bacterium]|nr:YihY/virulence factor BrkB family protein [Actinomycetota bacterium]
MKDSPLELRPATWPRTLRRTAAQFGDDNLLQWAAALTFFTVLALFPAMLTLVALLGLIGGTAIEPLIDNASRLAPGAARDILLDGLRAVRDSEQAGVALVIGLASALWTASAYVGAFIPAANVVWDVDEGRPIWKKLILRIALTTGLLVLIAVAAITVVLTGPIAQEVGSIVRVGDSAVAIWQIAKWPFLAVVVMTLLAILYWASPNVRHPGWRWVTPGSVLALVLWIGASLGLTFYVATFSSYNETYGSIGAVVVFLIWLWLTNIAILLGAELNAELERTRAIERGMRPPDKEPYLPPSDGGD